MADNHANLDRRILRTQQLIVDALLSLLLEKDFGDIIIKDITERANVNRSTFYAHYEDKHDLLNKTIEDKLTVLGDLSRSHSDKYEGYRPDFDAPDPYFVALFEHLAGNETFYRIILGKMPSSIFTDKMLDVIRDSFFIRISNIGKEQKLLVPLDLLLDYISCSALGIIDRWLKQRMVYSPHYMALQLTRLSMLGVYKAMGVNETEGR